MLYTILLNVKGRRRALRTPGGLLIAFLQGWVGILPVKLVITPLNSDRVKPRCNPVKLRPHFDPC